MRWPWDPPLLRVVIVNLKDDTSTAIRGVLWTRGPWFTIRQAEMLKTNVPPTPLDGEVVIHRSNIAFLQVLP